MQKSAYYLGFKYPKGHWPACPDAVSWHGNRGGKAAGAGTSQGKRRFCAVYSLEQVAMRPKVSFDSMNIWRRLEMCKTVAKAYGWKSADISSFIEEVSEAFSYEEAMAIIKRDFDVLEETKDQLLGF